MSSPATLPSERLASGNDEVQRGVLCELKYPHAKYRSQGFFVPIKNSGTVLLWKDRPSPSKQPFGEEPSFRERSGEPVENQHLTAMQLWDALLDHAVHREQHREASGERAADGATYVLLPGKELWRLTENGRPYPRFDPRELATGLGGVSGVEHLVAAAANAGVQLPGLLLRRGHEKLGNALQDVMYYRHPDGNVPSAHARRPEVVVTIGRPGAGSVTMLIRANGKLFRRGTGSFWWRQCMGGGSSGANSALHPDMYVHGTDGSILRLIPRQYSGMTLSDVMSYFGTRKAVVHRVPSFSRKTTTDKRVVPPVDWSDSWLPWNEPEPESETSVDDDGNASMCSSAGASVKSDDSHVRTMSERRAAARADARDARDVAAYRDPGIPDVVSDVFSRDSSVYSVYGGESDTFTSTPPSSSLMCMETLGPEPEPASVLSDMSANVSSVGGTNGGCSSNLPAKRSNAFAFVFGSLFGAVVGKRQRL